MIDSYGKNSHARGIFNGIANSYEAPAQIFSLFQYRRWHRRLVSQLRLTSRDSVLDVCTGTGLVATDIANSIGCSVIGLDLSDAMIKQAAYNIQSADPIPSVSLVQGKAEGLPFSDNSFDALVFTFLLRYVESPQDTLLELARVVRPGGQIISLEFYIPQNPVLYLLWLFHTRIVLRLGTRFISQGWREVGAFLGPSISTFYSKYSLEDIVQMWTRAGIRDIRTDILSVGGAVIMWGNKESYAEK